VPVQPNGFVLQNTEKFPLLVKNSTLAVLLCLELIYSNFSPGGQK